jgi:hypothetical protein
MMNKFWWEEDDESLHEAVFSFVEGLEESQKYIHELNIRNARLYSNVDMLGLDWTLTQRDYSRKSLGRVTENLIQSVCDTATSMIAGSNARVTFQTDGAEFSVQRRAKMLEKWIEGKFDETSFHREAARAFRDAVIFGTGALKIYEYNKDIKCERVLIDEIKIDEMECRSDSPRQLHQVKFIDKEILKADYPEFADQIEESSKDRHSERASVYNLMDTSVAVCVESYHLPSKKGAKDGKRTICIDNATLVSEKWKNDYFPFLFYRWNEPVCGFYGQGLSEQLTGIQLRINQLNAFIQKAQDLIAVPRVFVDIASKNLKMQLNNEIGAIIPYRGKPPIFHTAQAVSQEIYQYKESLWRRGFEIAGISQMAATSKKPVGLESAVALREYNDIGTQRFSFNAQEYERLSPKAAERMIDIARDIYGRGGECKSVFHAKKLVEKICFKNADLKDGTYKIRLEPASILSRTPAGRSQQVVEWAQAGIIDTDEARRLLNHPDLERAADMNNAAIEDIEATIEELLDGEYRSPEPYQNLDMGIRRVQMAYLKARRDGAPENTLEDMRRWIESADYILKETVAEEQAEMQMMVQERMMEEQAMQGAPAGGPPPMAPPEAGPPPAALASQAQLLRPTGIPS